MGLNIVDLEDFKNICITFSFHCNDCRRLNSIVFPYGANNLPLGFECECGQNFKIKLKLVELKTRAGSAFSLTTKVLRIKKDANK